jgi:hypothetical protein
MLQNEIFLCNCGAWTWTSWGPAWYPPSVPLPPNVRITSHPCESCQPPRVARCKCGAWTRVGSGAWFRATSPPVGATYQKGECPKCRDARRTLGGGI